MDDRIAPRFVLEDEARMCGFDGCRKLFRKVEDVRDHIQDHLHSVATVEGGRNMFKCSFDECEHLCLDSPAAFVAHVMRHFQPYPFECPHVMDWLNHSTLVFPLPMVCNERFDSLTSLMLHRIEQHGFKLNVPAVNQISEAELQDAVEHEDPWTLLWPPQWSKPRYARKERAVREDYVMRRMISQIESMLNPPSFTFERWSSPQPEESSTMSPGSSPASNATTLSTPVSPIGSSTSPDIQLASNEFEFDDPLSVWKQSHLEETLDVLMKHEEMDNSTWSKPEPSNHMSLQQNIESTTHWHLA